MYVELNSYVGRIRSYPAYMNTMQLPVDILYPPTKKMHSRDYNSPEILRNLKLSKNIPMLFCCYIIQYFFLLHVEGMRKSYNSTLDGTVESPTVLKKHINNQIPGRKEIHICTAEKMLQLKIHSILIFRSFKIFYQGSILAPSKHASLYVKIQ